MLVLGLTGGMGAGKTTVAGLFRRQGWPVFDADASVHRLQGAGGAAVPAIAARWPDAVSDGIVDRFVLRKAVIGRPEEISYLETIIHPLVRLARRNFLLEQRRYQNRGCILDIPLLFETGADRECDAVIVVTAPLSVRLHRVMRRRSLSATQAHALISRQMPDRDRCRRADFVIQTGLSRFHTLRQVRRVITILEKRS